MTNKVKAVRNALGLTQKQIGEIFTGKTGRGATETWGRWERTGNWPAPVTKMLKTILTLKMAEDHKTRNAHGALALVLFALSDKD